MDWEGLALPRITELVFDHNAFRSTGMLFWPDIEMNPWMLFHGTSGQFQDLIESDGIRSAQAGLDWARDIQAVVRCYETLSWSGTCAGGFAVLASFSVADHATNKGASASLAHTSAQACLYSLPEYAGGEVARAMRKALIDLDLFLGHQPVRRAHHDRLRRQARNDASTRVIDPESQVEWLRTEVQALADVRARSNTTLALHQCGVVYAVLGTESDLPRLRNEHHSVRWGGGVPPERLHAKVMIPNALGTMDIQASLDAAIHLWDKQQQFPRL